MERIKEISRKYILDDDFEGLMDILDKLKKSFKNESVDIMKKHLIKITKTENEYFIEFDNIEKVKIEESNILPYLEYLLQIYKDTAKNPNCIIKPVIKIKPNYNYIQIVVVDVKIKIKNAMVDNIFESLKNNGLINSYSIYSSDEKYQKIKKCNYCLSPDEFEFQFIENLKKRTLTLNWSISVQTLNGLS